MRVRFYYWMCDKCGVSGGFKDSVFADALSLDRKAQECHDRDPFGSEETCDGTPYLTEFEEDEE